MSVKEDELIEQLPAILEKYRTYQELKNQYSQIDSQVVESENKLKNIRRISKTMKISRRKVLRVQKRRPVVSGCISCGYYIRLYFTKSYIIGAIILALLCQ